MIVTPIQDSTVTYTSELCLFLSGGIGPALLHSAVVDDQNKTDHLDPRLLNFLDRRQEKSGESISSGMRLI